MNILKEAHKLTKEIKKEFPEVDYKAQLSICISYLSQERRESEMTAVEKIENEVKTIADERGYRDDFKVSVKTWETKDKSKKRVYVNVEIGKKQCKGYVDCITEKCFFEEGWVSVIKELNRRLLTIMEENKTELINL